MCRIVFAALFAPLLAGVLACSAASAQSLGCHDEPNGPPMDIELQVAPSRGPGQPPAIAGFGLAGVPALGHTCRADAALPADILHGEQPARARGLLRGDGPRDILGNRASGRVTVGPAR